MFKKQRIRSKSEENAFYETSVKDAFNSFSSSNSINNSSVSISCAPQELTCKQQPIVPVQCANSNGSSLAINSCVGSGAVVNSNFKFQLFLEDPERDDAFCAVDLWHRKPNLYNKPLLLIGDHGVGLTYLAHYGQYNLEYYFDQDPQDFLLAKGLGQSRTVGIIDTIEHLEPQERKIIKQLLTSNKKVRRIILTSNSAFSEPTKSWSSFCQVVKVSRPSKAFASKVLKTEFTLETWLNFHGNLASAAHSVLWSSLVKKHLGNLSCADSSMDFVRTTTNLLQHSKVQCSGDSSFVQQLWHLNLTSTKSCTLATLAKSYEMSSLFDVMDTSHTFEQEKCWSFLESMSMCAPAKKPQDAYVQFIWPKSTCALQKKKFTYE